MFFLFWDPIFSCDMEFFLNNIVDLSFPGLPVSRERTKITINLHVDVYLWVASRLPQ